MRGLIRGRDACRCALHRRCPEIAPMLDCGPDIWALIGSASAVLSAIGSQAVTEVQTGRRTSEIVYQTRFQEALQYS